MTGRLKTCIDLLREHKLPAFLVTNFYNVGYLSGFWPLSLQEREVFLFLTPKEFFLLTDGRYINQVKTQSTGFNCLEITSENNFYQMIATLVQKFKIKKMAFEKNDLSFGEYEKLENYLPITELHPTQNLIEEKRAIKDHREINSIKKACQIADQAFSHLLKFIKPGLTEKEVADEIEWFIRKRGAVDLSFDPIVASGVNSAFPHYRPGNHKLRQQDIVLLDFGARVDNYCSDMTRVVFLGKATEDQKKVYQTVLESQMRVIEKLNNLPAGKAGLTMKQLNNRTMRQSPTKASDIDHTARTYITSQGYPSIPHGLGHGVGLCEHESPRLRPKNKDILIPGMVFSVEPGIYLSRQNGGFGVRIEDLVYLTPSGPQLLTKSPKEIIELHR